MASNNYIPALNRCLVHEGGWSDHPADPGGATMRGVIQRVYDGYRDRRKLPRQSVRQISETELQEIYRTQYADKILFDKLPFGLDYVVLDGAINSGPSQSIKWLQRALGVKVDGQIGNATLGAIAKVANLDALISKICDNRMAFLRALKTWKTFGKGWAKRVDQVGDAGQDWASGSVPRDNNLTYVPGMEVKALLEDAKAPPSKAVADAATGGGGTSVLITQAIAQVNPLAGTSGFIDNVIVGLTLAGVLVTVGGLAFRQYQKYRQARRAEVLDLETSG